MEYLWKSLPAVLLATFSDRDFTIIMPWFSEYCFIKLVLSGFAFPFRKWCKSSFQKYLYLEYAGVACPKIVHSAVQWISSSVLMALFSRRLGHAVLILWQVTGLPILGKGCLSSSFFVFCSCIYLGSRLGARWFFQRFLSGPLGIKTPEVTRLVQLNLDVCVCDREPFLDVHVGKWSEVY